MVIIKFLDSKENDRYIIDPSSTKLGRRYDDNSEFIQVIFPESEIDSKCTMIVKDALNNGVDLIEFNNNEIKGVTTTLSQFDKVLIGFVFTKDNYVKYSSYKTFYFEPSLYPNNFEPKEPEFKGSYLEIIDRNFASARNNVNNANLIEFLNIKGEVVDTIVIVGNGGGGVVNETDPTIPNHVKNITQQDINNWNNKIDSSVDNLVNYYLKKDTYTKNEVNQLISAIRTLKKEIVDELPTENIDDNTIYLVPKTSGSGNDYYDEYIYINSNFEFIGSTQVDLRDYVKSEQLNEVKATIPTFITTLLDDGSYSLSITTPKEE